MSVQIASRSQKSSQNGDDNNDRWFVVLPQMIIITTMMINDMMAQGPVHTLFLCWHLSHRYCWDTVVLHSAQFDNIVVELMLSKDDVDKLKDLAVEEVKLPAELLHLRLLLNQCCGLQLLLHNQKS